MGEQRGWEEPAEEKKEREKTLGAAAWLFLGWALHYIPFWTMGRVLYVHHYYPALLFGNSTACDPRFDCWRSVLHFLHFLPSGVRDVWHRRVCKGDKLHHTPSTLALNMGVLTIILCCMYNTLGASNKTSRSEICPHKVFSCWLTLTILLLNL